MTAFGTGAIILLLFTVIVISAVVISSIILWLKHKHELKLEEDRISLVANVQSRKSSASSRGSDSRAREDILKSP